MEEPKALSAPKKQLSKTASANEIQEGRDSSQAGCITWQCFLHSAAFKGMKDARVKGLCILSP